MSLSHMKAAIDQAGISQTEKLVLIILAEYANPDTGECWPAHASVATKAGLSRDTVGRVCRALQEKGLLLIQPQLRENGSRTSNRVIVFPPKMVVDAPIQAFASDTPPTQDRVPPVTGSGTPPSQDRDQNLPDINISRAHAREGEDWKDFDRTIRETAGDAVDEAAPAIASAYVLRLLLSERPNSPACTMDEILDGVTRASAWYRSKGWAGKMRNWDMAVKFAIEARDKRINGIPVKAPIKPKSPATDLGEVGSWSHERWAAAIKVNRNQGGKWPPQWGPEPGATGSKVPEDLVKLWKEEAHG